jgi:hypothetical protein
MFRFLREAGIVTEEWQIRPSLLSLRIRNHINKNNSTELLYFPGAERFAPGD